MKRSNSRPIRILYIDDNSELRAILELLLSNYPEFKLVGCLDRADGLLEVLGNEQIDIVLLDLSMPGRNPLEAMVEARLKFPAVRFLVLSAYDDEKKREQAIQSGAAKYLLKDGDFVDLMNTIRETAGRSSAE